MHIAKRKGNARKIWTFWISVWDSDASPHWQPLRSKFLAYLCAFHREHRSTRYHRLERHRCNTVLPGVLFPSRLAYSQMFALRLHPNSRYTAWLDLRWSGCRLCFFVANEGVQLIQLCHLRFFRQFRWWQLLRVGCDPIGDALMCDFQDPPNTSQTVAFQIEFDRLQSYGFRITLLVRFWCIGPLANSTTIFATTWSIEAYFVLFCSWWTSWTLHTTILIYFPLLPLSDWVA